MSMDEVSGMGYRSQDLKSLLYEEAKSENRLKSKDIEKEVPKISKAEEQDKKKEPSETQEIEKKSKELASETLKKTDVKRKEEEKSVTVKVVDQTLRFEVRSEVNSDSGVVEKKLVVSVLDGETGKVIRTVPPDQLKSQISKVSNLIGMMLDKEV